MHTKYRSALAEIKTGMCGKSLANIYSIANNHNNTTLTATTRGEQRFEERQDSKSFQAQNGSVFTYWCSHKGPSYFSIDSGVQNAMLYCDYVYISIVLLAKYCLTSSHPASTTLLTPVCYLSTGVLS